MAPRPWLLWAAAYLVLLCAQPRRGGAEVETTRLRAGRGESAARRGLSGRESAAGLIRRTQLVAQEATREEARRAHADAAAARAGASLPGLQYDPELFRHWPAPPSRGAAPPRPRAAAPRGPAQAMVLSTGTAVTLWAPRHLTREELVFAAKSVVHLTRDKGRCECFCTWVALHPQWAGDGTRSSAEPTRDVNCACVDEKGAAHFRTPRRPDNDQYGNPLGAGWSLGNITRYALPEDSDAFDVPWSQDLLLALDAGDRRSYDARDPQVWKDVSGAGRVGHVKGFVGFNASAGAGALRFGAHSTRDVVVVQGLDISRAAAPRLTIETWVRLEGYPMSTGRVAGNSQDPLTLGGRSIFLHNPHYGPPGAAAAMPARRDNAAFTARSGRVGASTGHIYESEVLPPRRGAWTQYVAVWTPAKVALFCDGVQVDSQPVYEDGGDAAPSGSGHFSIGNHEFDHARGPYRVNGHVGLVRVWNRALPADDVALLYEHSKARFEG